jgi:hypothetical protein
MGVYVLIASLLHTFREALLKNEVDTKHSSATVNKLSKHFACCAQLLLNGANNPNTEDLPQFALLSH